MKIVLILLVCLIVIQIAGSEETGLSDSDQKADEPSNPHPAVPEHISEMGKSVFLGKSILERSNEQYNKLIRFLKKLKSVNATGKTIKQYPGKTSNLNKVTNKFTSTSFTGDIVTTETEISTKLNFLANLSTEPLVDRVTGETIEEPKSGYNTRISENTVTSMNANLTPEQQTDDTVFDAYDAVISKPNTTDFLDAYKNYVYTYIFDGMKTNHFDNLPNSNATNQTDNVEMKFLRNNTSYGPVDQESKGIDENYKYNVEPGTHINVHFPPYETTGGSKNDILNTDKSVITDDGYEDDRFIDDFPEDTYLHKMPPFLQTHRRNADHPFTKTNKTNCFEINQAEDNAEKKIPCETLISLFEKKKLSAEFQYLIQVIPADVKEKVKDVRIVKHRTDAIHLECNITSKILSSVLGCCFGIIVSILIYYLVMQSKFKAQKGNIFAKYYRVTPQNKVELSSNVNSELKTDSLDVGHEIDFCRVLVRRNSF